MTTKDVPKKDWDELMFLLKTVDISALKTLKPSSKKFQFDGAPMARLTLNVKEQELSTPIFDHGSPPKTTADIVNKVLTLKENTLQN